MLEHSRSASASLRGAVASRGVNAGTLTSSARRRSRGKPPPQRLQRLQRPPRLPPPPTPRTLRTLTTLRISI
eukprot:2298241-Prymnesium_polylepis.1